MSLLDYGEQLDWYQRMQMEREDEVEQHIREAAQKYCERSAKDIAAMSGYPHPHLGQRIVVSKHPPQGAAQSGAALYASQVYIDVKIDVDPHIQGFARQIIAEEQIREQINNVEFP